MKSLGYVPSDKTEQEFDFENSGNKTERIAYGTVKAIYETIKKYEAANKVRGVCLTQKLNKAILIYNKMTRQGIWERTEILSEMKNQTDLEYEVLENELTKRRLK